jgi:hypothetical protein
MRGYGIGLSGTVTPHLPKLRLGPFLSQWERKNTSDSIKNNFALKIEDQARMKIVRA